MNRDEFKILSYGQYTYTNLQNPTQDKKELISFVNGALFAWDYLQKKKRENEKNLLHYDNNINKVHITNEFREGLEL